LLYFETNNWASSKSRAFFFSSQSKENSWTWLEIFQAAIKALLVSIFLPTK
jgi:hypothetical protein